MSHPSRRTWDATVRADGGLALPPGALKEAGLAPGMHVRVQFADVKLHPALRRRGVTEQEVTGIAATQMADGDSVVRCLLTEGRLASSRTFGRKLPG